MTDYLALFRTRLLHAEALVELARDQRTLAAAGDYDRLLDSLQRKQRIIDRMTAADASASAGEPSLRDRWNRDCPALPDAVRQECEMLLDRCEQHLDETLDHEREAIATVTAARSAVNDQLHNLTAGRQTQAGYTPPASPKSLLDAAG